MPSEGTTRDSRRRRRGARCARSTCSSTRRDDQRLDAEAAQQDVQSRLVEPVHAHLLDDVISVLRLEALGGRRAPGAADERIGPLDALEQRRVLLEAGGALLDEVPDVDHGHACRAAGGREVLDVLTTFWLVACAGAPESANAPPSMITSFCRSWMTRAAAVGPSALRFADCSAFLTQVRKLATSLADPAPPSPAWDFETPRALLLPRQ